MRCCRRFPPITRSRFVTSGIGSIQLPACLFSSPVSMVSNCQYLENRQWNVFEHWLQGYWRHLDLKSDGFLAHRPPEVELLQFRLNKARWHNKHWYHLAKPRRRRSVEIPRFLLFNINTTKNTRVGNMPTRLSVTLAACVLLSCLLSSWRVELFWRGATWVLVDIAKICKGNRCYN